MKIDRLLAKQDGMGRAKARSLIAAGRVRVDGNVIRRNDWEVSRFSGVQLDEAWISLPQRRLSLMLHKPVGVLSATRDAEFQTVIDLIDDPDRDSLHLVGRLDRATSGLVLLTNDGTWSKALMDPARKVPKVYRVETSEVISEDAVAAFARGFYFHTEDLTTLPAELEILGERQARLTLFEGRYHQIKRMFHRLGNRVTALHRERIGPITLPEDMPPGAWRALSTAEVAEANAQPCSTIQT